MLKNISKLNELLWMLVILSLYGLQDVTHVFFIPNHTLILVSIVITASYRGGLGVGIISAVMYFIYYYIHFFVLHSTYFQDKTLNTLLIFSFVGFVLYIGWLRERRNKRIQSSLVVREQLITDFEKRIGEDLEFLKKRLDAITAYYKHQSFIREEVIRQEELKLKNVTK